MMSESLDQAATVQRIILNGKHGPYAVASLKRDKESVFVTFSLSQPVWREDGLPEEGNIVILKDIRKKKAGWRAYIASFVRLQ